MAVVAAFKLMIASRPVVPRARRMALIVARCPNSPVAPCRGWQHLAEQFGHPRPLALGGRAEGQALDASCTARITAG